MMKKIRHALILDLIGQNDISTQEELLKMLHDNGVVVTQATVSRDIKELRLIKQPSLKGQYKYCVGKSPNEDKNTKYYSFFSESVISVDFASNICLLKCHIGTAQAACAAIDSMNWDEVVGTLAGDDTIFILCRTKEVANDICEMISRQLNL